MKKAKAFAAVIALSAVTFAFTTKPFSVHDEDSPMLKIVEETFHNAMSIKSTSDRNHDFVHYVTALHAGGIKLAQYEIANGHHKEVKAIAQMAIDTMKNDLMMLERYLGATPVKPDTDDKFAKEFHDALDQMHKKADNTNLKKGDIDHDYAALMNRILDAEREVGKAYIKYGADPQLERIAKRLTQERKEEVKDHKEGKQEVKREDKK